MNYDTFVDQGAQRAAAPTERAAALTRAALETLAERLTGGEVLALGDIDLPHSYTDIRAVAAGLATLRLPLPEQEGGPGPLRLALEMQAPRMAMEVLLRIRLPDAAPLLFSVPLAAEEAATCLFDLPATAARVLEVEIDSGEGLPALQHGEARRLGLGLRGFMLCRLDDHLSRLAFLESRSFTSVNAE